jgi:hypothetical protein
MKNKKYHTVNEKKPYNPIQNIMSSLDHKLICLMKRDACTQILKFILINDDQSIFLSMQIKCTLFDKQIPHCNGKQIILHCT